MPAGVQTCTISKSIHLGQGFSVIELNAPKLARATLPSQHFVLARLDSNEELTSIAHVLPALGVTPSAGARAETLQFLIPAEHSALIAPQFAGDSPKFVLRGPLGMPWTADANTSALMLVAEGSAAASLAFIAQSEALAGKEVTLLNGAANKLAMPWIKVLNLLSSFGVTLLPTTQDGSLGVRGDVFTPLASELAARAEKDVRCQVLAAGSDAFISRVHQVASRHGYETLAWQHHTWRCGWGVCGACEVDTADGGALRPCSEVPALPVAQISSLC